MLQHLDFATSPDMYEQTQSSSASKDDLARSSSKLTFPVVGMGASAGGLQAVTKFVEHLPTDTGMAFVVVLHLSPEHESNAAEILQKYTAVPVLQVREKLPLRQNHVYVIPPNKQLSMEDGCLFLSDLDQTSHKAVTIDLFFRTLAESLRERAFGLVLSGIGADGAAGLARIKELGGVTFAQSPDEAEYPGMPTSAIETGVADFILPATEMPAKLVELWQNAQAIHLPEPDETKLEAPVTLRLAGKDSNTEQVLLEIISLLRIHTGHDFSHYKQATIIRRIERRLQVCGLTDLTAYRDRLKADEEENRALLDDLLIGVTNFFRDPEAFAALEGDVIPRLFRGKQHRDQVRVWVAACATGEEAYSLAMLLFEQAAGSSAAPTIQVFATDIDEDAIATGRTGTYPESIATDVTATRLRQFFIKQDGHYRIKKMVRDSILFASHNLLRDPPFSKLDLITCRNLLIYLTRDVQKRLLEMFHFALKPGGYLFLGTSESADAVPELFTPVDKKNRIYRAKALAHSTRYSLSMPMAPATRLPPTEQGEQAAKRKFSFADMHQRVLTQYAPPSVIVDMESNIVHMSEHAGNYLRYIGGEPSHNLIALVLPELRLELRTALFQAVQKGRGVEARRVQVRRGEHAYWITMMARPFHDDEAGGDFVLVLFDEIEVDACELVTPTAHDRKDAVVAQLEEELQRTKEQLQDTIERSEVSTEELKASNEELQAINEELRSATEELETSKEELQSTNEELVTVNHELKMKVEEAGKINDDLNNLIASTDIATIFVDQGLRIKRYTPRAVDIFNIIPADIGRSLLDITHRLDYAQLTDDASTAFETLHMVEREVRSNDGTCYIVRMLPYRTTEDRIEGAVLTFIDITSRRSAEERLKAGEERIRLFAESTKDYAIITSDAAGTITSWNKGAERMFGYREEEAVGQKLDIIFLPEDIQAGIPEEERHRARADGRSEEERWHMHKDGTRLYCSGVTTPLDNDGFYGYAKIARDLTERVQHDTRRDAQLAREQAENMLKDQFLAVMSHELKQPLNLIQLNAEMLTMLPEVRNSEVSRRAASVIQRSVLSQAKIIDDLLDLSRLTTGKLALNLTPVDLAAHVNALVDVMRRDAANVPAISVSSIDTPVIVHADPVRVDQIIWNLLSNAIKFTPASGSIHVSLTQAATFAELEVCDTGQGIAPEFLPHIFDIFRQAAPPTTRAKGGLGIGMALVKELTELHGGKVEASSEGLEKGACIRVWLPLQNQSGTIAERSAPDGKKNLSGLRILVIDDVSDAVEMMELLLQAAGATVASATSATEALRILGERDFDLIVSDIAMPEVDGYEFIRRVRAQPKHAHIPAIAVTGFSRKSDVEHALDAGFSAHIGKPLTVETLIEKIRTLIPG